MEAWHVNEQSPSKKTMINCVVVRKAEWKKILVWAHSFRTREPQEKSETKFISFRRQDKVFPIFLWSHKNYKICGEPQSRHENLLGWIYNEPSAYL